jgi:hypothetical protein
MQCVHATGVKNIVRLVSNPSTLILAKFSSIKHFIKGIRKKKKELQISS